MSIVEQLICFLQEIGIDVLYEPIPHKTFLPGLSIRNGALIIDREKLLYPGDILHEAGHLAVMPVKIRETMNDVLDNNQVHQGGELMAIAWSYACCLHLNIDPHLVFHEHGYKGEGSAIVEIFSNGRYFAVPLLQWCGMTYDNQKAMEKNARPYPHMINWVCNQNNYI